MPEGTPQKEAFEQAVQEFNASAEQFKVQLAKEWGLSALPVLISADDHAQNVISRATNRA